MDFDLRKKLNLGDISPSNSSKNPDDPGVPPLPTSVMGVTRIINSDSSGH